jgi:hypothetical protein
LIGHYVIISAPAITIQKRRLSRVDAVFLRLPLCDVGVGINV